MKESRDSASLQEAINNLKTPGFLPGIRSVREEKGGREPNLRIQGKMKEENPICHPENKSPDWKSF